MIVRSIEKELKSVAKQFRVLALTGPRQSGKTTILRNIFKNYTYFNLENLETLNEVESDKAGFIKNKSKVIIDEIQRVPELMHMIQAIVDERKIKGDFIISGSQNLLLSEKISQTLAGRAGYLKLLPLSILELKASKLLKKDLDTQLLTGFYPSIYDSNIDSAKYYDNYIQTYLERDLRNIKNIHDLGLFRKFVGLLAGRIGQLVNYESLANDTGVSKNTIENWISILESSYLIFRLQPYYENLGKRLTKTAKIYFTDTGLACFLLGIGSEEELNKHYIRGSLFENMCVIEVWKYLLNNGINASLFFYRDSNGNEVDLIIQKGLKKIPIEIKSGTSFSSEYLKGIKYWNSLKNMGDDGFVVYNGESKSTNSDKFRFLNWKEINEIFKRI